MPLYSNKHRTCTALMKMNLLLSIPQFRLLMQMATPLVTAWQTLILPGLVLMEGLAQSETSFD
ncbi:hypothetical protein DPMN_025777 [Dreissena polymorpha]|uniref:Uncharacterized protein n=1 Tax=Dreissena polymorpha TaxID=45954 RepID=A0A9D4RDM4_DREPO|nr:hypothetical protein DPMN_025777 [Dreissena polymorpha]